jgi:hypothetical protein
MCRGDNAFCKVGRVKGLRALAFRPAQCLVAPREKISASSPSQARRDENRLHGS